MSANVDGSKNTWSKHDSKPILLLLEVMGLKDWLTIDNSTVRVTLDSELAVRDCSSDGKL